MPTRQSVHIDRALTNMSVAYMQEEKAFIAAKVFPIVPVMKQSDVYFIYSRADFYRDEAEVRVAGTESAGGDYAITQADPFFCKRWAFHKDISDEDVVNADTPIQPKQDAMDFVMHKLLISREVAWASKFFITGVWGAEVVGVDDTPVAGTSLVKFNLSTSVPIEAMNNMSIAMAAATGYKPNTLVLAPAVYSALKNHEDILDRIKYTQKGIVTTDLLAQLFDVDNVYVPWGVKNTAVKGATEATDFIMGKHALLCYVNPRPAIKKPSAGYIFAWKGLLGATAYGNRIVRIPMPWLGDGVERVEGEMAFDPKLIASDLGSFMLDIVD